MHLGFQNISNGNKKENTINKLKNLPYAAGSTFTGLSLFFNSVLLVVVLYCR